MSRSWPKFLPGPWHCSNHMLFRTRMNSVNDEGVAAFSDSRCQIEIRFGPHAHRMISRGIRRSHKLRSLHAAHAHGCLILVRSCNVILPCFLKFFAASWGVFCQPLKQDNTLVCITVQVQGSYRGLSLHPKTVGGASDVSSAALMSFFFLLVQGSEISL